MAWVKYKGDATLAEMQQLCELLQPTVAEYGYVIMIVDSREAGVLSAEGRRFMAGWLSSTPNQGIFISASVLPRTIVTMIDRAAEHLSGKVRQPEYVASVAEAEALLPELRARLRSQVDREKPPAP